MVVYFGILIFSSIFSYCYSKSKDLSASVVFLSLCFLTLFLPAALRYGIGADFFSYLSIYRRTLMGIPYKTEPVLLFLVKILQFFNFSGQSIIVAYAFLTNFFIFKGVPKKYFYLCIPIYVLMFYLETFCTLRQVLGCCITVYSFRLFMEEKYKKFIFWSIIAVLSHKTMIVPPLVIMVYNFVPYNKNYIVKMLFFIVYAGIVFVGASKLLNLVFTVVLGHTSYASYAKGFFANAVTQGNTGLGYMLKLLCMVIIAYLIDYKTLSKKEYKLVFALLICNYAAIVFASKMYIFARIVCIFYFSYIFFFITISKSSSKYRRLFIIFLIFSYILFFYLGIKSAVILPTIEPAGRMINPYVSIFNYGQNANVLARKRAFGF